MKILPKGRKVQLRLPSGDVRFYTTRQDVDVTAHFHTDPETLAEVPAYTGFGGYTKDQHTLYFALSQVREEEQATQAPVLTLRNDKTGEELHSHFTHAQAAAKFANQYGTRDHWLWYWLHKAVSEGQTRTADKALEFLGDQFLLAIGYGLKRPMIRLHFRDRRFKIYLSAKGTVCLKTGRLALDATGHPTKEAVGDEEYMGCLLRGKFLVATQDSYPDHNGRRTRGPERVLDATEKAFLDGLQADPVKFLAECSKDLGRCCYCNQPLSDERSKQVGYGPVCANHWGLPWGDPEYLEKAPSFAKVYADGAHNCCQTIRQRPEDAMAWEIFADWLEEQGLPRVTMPEGKKALPRHD